MADEALINLTEETSPAGTDLLYAVIDPGGTAADAKVQMANLNGALPVDGIAGTGTRRTLGTGAQQAAAGNHTHSYVATGVPGPPPDITLYTSGSGNWSKPSAPSGCAAYSRYRLRILGGGSGGGSGRKGATGSVRCGGGPGQGGFYTEIEGPLSDLASTVAYAVGTGGAGGSAQSTDSTNGNDGSTGTASTFGSYGASPGGPGLGGSATLGTAGNALVGNGVRPNIANNAISTGGTNTTQAAVSQAGMAGGAGGGITTANAASNGAPGQQGFVATTTPVGGVVGGASPINADAPASTVFAPGPGGSGGAGSTTGNGQAGNAGTGFGSGGGGGGAAVNSVGNSGAGGAGTGGAIEIIVW